MIPNFSGLCDESVIPLHFTACEGTGKRTKVGNWVALGQYYTHLRSEQWVSVSAGQLDTCWAMRLLCNHRERSKQNCAVYTDKVVSSVQYIYTAMITSPNLASRSRHVYIIYYNIRQEAVLSIFIKTMCSVYMRE